MTHATVGGRTKRHIPRPFAIAAVVTAVIAIGALVASRWFFAPSAAPSGTGTVSIITNPAGAQVIVDGESRGVTPVTLTLKAGVHVMQLRGAGQSRSMPVAIAANTQISQYIELPKGASGAGQLQVKTEPAGAQVSVDGVPRGVSPITVGDLTPGEHTVTLSNESGSIKHPVTILADATASLVVPLGGTEGYKGSGLAAMVEVLSGLLTGLGFGVEPTGRHNDGCFMAVFNVAAFRPLKDFKKEVAEFARYLKSTPPSEGSHGVFYPGEIEYLRHQQRRKIGIEIEDATWDKLRSLAAEYKIAGELGLA